MKNTLYPILKLLFAAALVLGSGACHDADEELFDADLGKLLRPLQVRALAVDYKHIAVSWVGAASSFTLEYASNPDFSADVTVVGGIEGNKYTVGALAEGTSYYFRLRGFSGKPDVAASEYSAVATARTLAEPKIPGVKASSDMVYTTSPWSVICTVTMTWGDPDAEPEAVSSVRATPTAGGEALTFPVSETEAAAQQAAFSEGIRTDTEYTFELFAGQRMRGSVVHRTVPGPIPALYASSQLDFSTDPVTASAVLRWELYYVPAADLAEILLTQQGAQTPGISVPVAPADIAAGQMAVADLTPGASYAADLKATDGRTIASAVFTTPEAPGQDVLVVRPGDDLGAIIADAERTYERIYLVAGEYTLTAESAVALRRNLELYSDDPSRTKIVVSKNFLPEGTLERIVFRNLRLECATYLIQAKKAYDIALLRFENCVVDLNSGATGASTLFNSATTTSAGTAMLDAYEVVGCVVFANAGQAQNIVYGSASGNNGEFGKLLMRNSTFANCARGLVYVTNTAERAYDVAVENCTLYNVASAGGNALIDIRMAGDVSGRRIALRNSVLWFGSTKGYKVLQLAGTFSKEQIDCANFYHFASQTPAFGSDAYNVADRMTPYAGTPADLWRNPMADPSAAGASFRVEDPVVRAAQQAVGTVLGDPRWE